jgi:hypothetical protein
LQRAACHIAQQESGCKCQADTQAEHKPSEYRPSDGAWLRCQGKC